VLLNGNAFDAHEKQLAVDSEALSVGLRLRGGHWRAAGFSGGSSMRSG
jgi:hypothetical protein